MKKFSDIKWSSFVREIISKRIEELEKIKSGVYADEKLLAENWMSEERLALVGVEADVEQFKKKSPLFCQITDGGGLISISFM